MAARAPEIINERSSLPRAKVRLLSLDSRALVTIRFSFCLAASLIAGATFSCTPNKPIRERSSITDVDGGFDAASPQRLPAVQIPCEEIVGSAASADLACAPIAILPSNGLAVGNTTGLGNRYSSSCGGENGADQVYQLALPGDMVELLLEVTASSFNPVIHVYGDEGCGPPSLFGCGAALSESASVVLHNVSTPSIHIIVDGAGSAGAYDLQATGVIAAGQSCIPDSQTFTCEFGTCSGREFPTCPGILDCADGIDVDNDGSGDEDAASCVSPPTVNCTADQTLDVLASATLVGTDSNAPARPRGRGTLEQSPSGATSRPGSSPDELLLDDRLAGLYRARYTVIDDARQAVACESTVTNLISDVFRVELLWNVTVPEQADPSDVDLHLLHPNATVWGDNLDCHWANGFPNWDGPDQTDDPRLDIDDVEGRGPENINILNPVHGEPYRVGVHYFFEDGFGASQVEVRIFCGGNLAASFGPVRMGQDDLWRVADVTFDADGCSVVPIESGGCAYSVSRRSGLWDQPR